VSHYPVTVVLSKARLEEHKGNVEEALEEILAPFYEQTEDKAFLEFEDLQDEVEKKYDKIPFKKKFKTVDEYAKEYCQYKRHPETGHWGYWHNPNAKWDWYYIGGRCSGFFPLKPEAVRALGRYTGKNAKNRHGDIVRVSDIDMTAVAKQTVEKAETFFREYQEMLEGKKFDAFRGPRSRAMSLGLVEVIREPVEATKDTVVFPWSTEVQPGDDRASWTDVCKKITREKFMAEYLDTFCPIATYAALNDEGWHAPGTMGWWACSNDTPETFIAYKKGFLKNVIEKAGPEDLLVLVDCHI